MTITFRTTQASSEHAREVTRVNEQINSRTTPEQFDELLRTYLSNDPSYLTSGGGRLGDTVLVTAIKMGNRDLVDHIVRIGGTNLLELSSRIPRQPPLTAAVLSNAEEADRYAIAARLIELGAPVNQAGQDGNFGATPLQVAISIGRLPIIGLLLRNGAIMVDGPIEGIPAELAAAAPVEPLDWPEKRAAIAFVHDFLLQIEQTKLDMKNAILAALPNMDANLVPLITAYAGHPRALNRVTLL